MTDREHLLYQNIIRHSDAYDFILNALAKINRLVSAVESTPEHDATVIDRTLMLIELGFEQGGFAPELSYGTHLFQDLVESDIIPLPLFPENRNSFGSLLHVKLDGDSGCGCAYLA